MGKIRYNIISQKRRKHQHRRRKNLSGIRKYNDQYINDYGHEKKRRSMYNVLAMANGNVFKEEKITMRV